MRYALAALLALLPVCAHAQRGQAVEIAPQSFAPSGGVVAVGTTATTAIAANPGRYRVGYQIQGTGYACASWVTATPTIASGTGAAIKCGGSGSFLVTAGSTDTRAGTLPSTALTAIGETGSSLQVVWEGQ